MLILCVYFYLKYTNKKIYRIIYFLLPLTIYIYLPMNIDIHSSTRLNFLLIMYSSIFSIKNLLDINNYILKIISLLFLLLELYFINNIIYSDNLNKIILNIESLPILFKLLLLLGPVFITIFSTLKIKINNY